MPKKANGFIMTFPDVAKQLLAGLSFYCHKLLLEEKLHVSFFSKNLFWTTHSCTVPGLTGGKRRWSVTDPLPG